MNLSDAELAVIRDWAGRTPRIWEVRLFGSRAKGTARADSDVDLALTVKGTTKQDAYTTYFFNVEGWRSALSEGLKLTADIHLYDERHSPKVFGFVVEHGLLIWSRAGSMDDPDRSGAR